MKKIFYLIQHDIKEGARYNFKKYIFTVILFLVFCADVYSQYKIHTERCNVLFQPTICDYILYIFRGMREYDPNLSEAFNIPAAWFAVQLGIAYFVGNYPTKDTEGYGIQYIIRSGSKCLWVASKCIYSAIATVQFYLIGYVVVAFWALLFGRFEFSLSEDIGMYISNINAEVITDSIFVICVLVLPLLTSIAVSIFQTVLMLVVRPMYSYLAIIVIVSASAYYKTYFLPLNYSMIFRMSPIVAGGLDPYIAVIIDIFLIILTVIFGCAIIRKFDFLEKRL